MKVLAKFVSSACLVPLLIVGCGGSDTDRPESITSPNVNGTPSLDKVYTYQTTSNSEQILSCSKLFLNAESCDVANIKPIGADMTRDVLLQDIKSRLVVSHEWMADSFIAALEEINDQDLLNLFKALNTIVLSYDIRPSFYHSYTASMYIDARYLWRNSDEWKTIYKQDDFRNDYQSEFIFDSFLRYVKPSSGEHITWSNSYGANSYDSRTSAQIAPGLFRLLSHELAHANDYLPPELVSNLGDSGKIYNDYIFPSVEINTELSNAQPLSSKLLLEVAQIAFHGSDMTDQVRLTSASVAGSEFDADGAADLYGYSSGAEDVAMLFEAFMMHKKYGAVSDVAFVTIPSNDEYSCNDYVVKWGQRNRLADRNVKQRAILVGSRILARDITLDLSSLAHAPIDMDIGIGWCSSRLKTNASSSERINAALSRTQQQVVHDYKDDRVRE